MTDCQGSPDDDSWHHFVLRSSPPRPSNPANRFCTDYPVKADVNRDAIIGGIVGGSFAFSIGYVWYNYSGAKTVAQTGNQTKKYFEDTLKKTKETAPPPDETIQWLRDTTMSYASMIPGGRGYVEIVFNDIDTVHGKHREEVDRIVRETYDELKEMENQRFGAGSVANAWHVVQKNLGKIGDLTKDAGGDILNNHPQLRDRFGGEFDKLKQMGESYRPEARKLVDQTWNRIQDTLRSGFSFETFGKVKGIVEDTTGQLKWIGDTAWQKAMEQARPYLA
jgi:hypothetical protein